MFASLLHLGSLNKLAQLLAHFEDLSICDFNVFVCLKLFLVHKCKSQLLQVSVAHRKGRLFVYMCASERE